MPKLKSQNEVGKKNLVENEIRLLSEAEYLKATGLKKINKEVIKKTKEQILKSLDDFPEIDQNKMWDAVMNIIDFNIDSDQPSHEISQKSAFDCLQLFDKYTFSDWQAEVFVPFIIDIINWKMEIENIEEPKKIKNKIKVNNSKLKPDEEFSFFAFGNEVGYATIVVNDELEEKLIDARYKINTKLDEYFDRSTMNKFLDTLGFGLSVFEYDESLFELSLGYLLHNKFTNSFTPFDEFKKAIAKQKKLNIYKKLYLDSLDNRIESIFIFEQIDMENNICWMRDVFSKQLYPVQAQIITENQDVMLHIFYASIVPIIKGDDIGTIYFNSGNITLLNPIYDINKIDKIDKSDLTIKEFSSILQQEFLISYDVYKDKFCSEIEPKLKEIKFTGHVQLLEKVYVAMMMRINERLAIL